MSAIARSFCIFIFLILLDHVSVLLGRALHTVASKPRDGNRLFPTQMT